MDLISDTNKIAATTTTKRINIANIIHGTFRRLLAELKPGNYLRWRIPQLTEQPKGTGLLGSLINSTDPVATLRR